MRLPTYLALCVAVLSIALGDTSSVTSGTQNTLPDVGLSGSTKVAGVDEPSASVHDGASLEKQTLADPVEHSDAVADLEAPELSSEFDFEPESDDNVTDSLDALFDHEGLLSEDLDDEDDDLASDLDDVAVHEATFGDEEDIHDAVDEDENDYSPVPEVDDLPEVSHMRKMRKRRGRKKGKKASGMCAEARYRKFARAEKLFLKSKTAYLLAKRLYLRAQNICLAKRCQKTAKYASKKAARYAAKRAANRVNKQAYALFKKKYALLWEKKSSKGRNGRMMRKYGKKYGKKGGMRNKYLMKKKGMTTDGAEKGDDENGDDENGDDENGDDEGKNLMKKKGMTTDGAENGDDEGGCDGCYRDSDCDDGRQCKNYACVYVKEAGDSCADDCCVCGAGLKCKYKAGKGQVCCRKDE